MRATFRFTFLFGSLALLVWGCTPSSSSSPSAIPSASPSDAAVSNFPPGCGPIDLRGPTGERIVLDGRWVEVQEAAPMTWWVRTQGNCVWGNGQIEDVPTLGGFGARPDQVQSLDGVIGSDFVITGEILFLGPIPPGAPGSLTPYSPLRMLIVFDDAGGITLQEDREPMVPGPRCPDPTAYCPDPLVLRPG